MTILAAETKGRLVRVTVPLASAYASLDAHVKKAYQTETYDLLQSFDPKTKHMTGFIVFVADKK